MFPNDAITKINILSGTTSVTLESGTAPKTILGVQIEQENVASNTIVKCGTDDIVHNYATSTPQILMSYLCENDLTIDKTGNDHAVINVTYVNYNKATSHTDFSSGELFISLLLFIGLLMALTLILIKAISIIPVHKKFLGVNSIEGKEKYKI